MSNPEATRAGSREGIAIIGMAGRFPQAKTIEEFWHNLRTGVEAISFFTDEEIEAAGIDFPKNNPNYVRARGLLEEADHLDAAFFGINPKEAEIMDPQHRVFLECAWEALERAGYDSERTGELIGVFAGMSMNTYLLSNLWSHPELLELVGNYQVMLANDKDYLPTRVSYKLNLKGPSMSIQTACSTSLVAVCVACQNLLSYQCDVALAGGVSISFPQKKGHLYQEGGITSPDGHCRAFDARAQGTVAGEGAGVVVLKRVEEALADGDQIYAVIKGWGINNDGSLKMGYSAPSEDGQAEVIALAQAVAGFEPETIRYVVTHGTGTPLGDPIEIAALTKAFRAGANANGFCALTSVKTNIGHLDAAAGIAGLINAALALHHKFIPPSLHFETPNPKIDFANSPFFVNSRPTEWRAGPTPRRAGVSSFGIGGTNAHVVLEEAPPMEASGASRPQQLLLLSAKTASALEAATANLAAHLKADPELDLPDAAYTLQVGRRAFPHRRMLVCRDGREAAEMLESPAAPRVLTQMTERASPAIAFMFPGQGAQHVNMGLELYQTEPVFREQIELCAEMLEPQLGLNLRQVLYPPADQFEEANAQLRQTLMTQPAVFAVNYALAKLWMSWGVEPQAMIGHSVGEFVAACLAGVFSLKDGLSLIAARARLIQQRPAGAMLAIRLEEREVQPWLDGKLSLAAVNSPSVCVVSGLTEDIEALQDQLRERGVASQRLQTSHAFHSALMEPVLGPFTELVKRIHLQPPRIPYISGVSATWITAEQALDPNYWGRHLRQTVRFAEGIGELLKDPERILLEVGPGQMLSALARQHPAAQGERRVLSSLPLAQSQQSASAVLLRTLGQLWLAGTVVDWTGFHAQERRRRLRLPTYPFERKRYWVEPAKPLLMPQTYSQSPSSRTADYGVGADRPAAPLRQLPVTPLSRRDLIASMLEGLLSELSGLSLRQMEGSTTFMEMGFDSLFLTQASQAIEQRLGVRVAFADLLEKHPSLDRLAAHLDQTIAPDKDLTVPPEPRKAPVPVGPGAVRIGAHGELEGVLAVPLTEAQKELWYATLMGEKASCVFNESMALRLRGPLDLEAMRKAIQHLVERHEALRTSISPVGDEQQIFPRVRIEAPLLDLSRLEAGAREAEFNALMVAASAQAFDLSQPPLLRCQLVRMEEQFHYLIFVVHHIVCDGGSVMILMDELAGFYCAERAGVSVEALPPVQFSEYARAHARKRGSPEQLADEAYWLDEFSTPPPNLELPTDRPRPAKLGFNGAREFHPIDPALWQDLKRLSAQQSCTLFTVLLAAYYVFLHRLSGQEDIVVGVPMAVREGIEKLVGHCVNFLPLRGEITANPRFTEHLAQVRKSFFEAFDHQNYTFGSLIQKLNLPRNSSRMPLLSATFNLARGRSELKLAKLETKVLPNPNCFANFDLTFDLLEKDGELELICTYNTDLFDPQTVQRWLGHFHTLLEEIAARPSHRISELSLLSVRERNQILVQWNNTRADYPRSLCLHQLFEAQVERTPQACAIRLLNQNFSYRELNHRANQIAHHLRRCGIGPEVCVGICAAPSFEVVAGLLGILKAGGAYVPLDSGDPAERQRFILEDTQAKVLLTGHRPLGALPRHRAKVICLDGDSEALAGESTRNPRNLTEPKNLAYVMYTSGSAGTPKGVMIEHRNVVALVDWGGKTFSAEELSGVLAPASICFDLSVFELFVPLCRGGTVVLTENTLPLPSLLESQQVRMINTIPSVMIEFLKVGKLPESTQTINLAGEAAPAWLVARLYEQPSIQKVYDLYGPSEDTTFTTCALRSAQGPATIGRPLANKQVYILDAYQEPAPIGVPGELYIGGAGVARGYLNRPELTAERFVANPFSDDPAGRLYRSGDRARYGPDGNIEFLGRLDQQLKIGGFRIEPGEIEAVLGGHPQVRQCVATSRPDESGELELVAFVALNNGTGVAASELRHFLSEKLPAYMVPSDFVFLETLPVLPSGKVDRSRLPMAAAEPTQEETQEAPSLSETEKLLSEIWLEVIGLKEVGIHDNFFELGGHSVLVTQIISRVRKIFHVDLNLRTVFESPTIATLALEIEEALIEEIQELPEEEAQQLSSTPNYP